MIAIRLEAESPEPDNKPRRLTMLIDEETGFSYDIRPGWPGDEHFGSDTVVPPPFEKRQLQNPNINPHGPILRITDAEYMRLYCIMIGEA